MIRICVWLPPIAASVPSSRETKEGKKKKRKKERKRKKKIAVAHSGTLLASKLGDESLPMADDTRCLLLMDSPSLSLSLSLSSTPSDYPRILSPWSDRVQPPIGGKKNGISLFLTHGNWRDSRVEWKSRKFFDWWDNGG